VPAFPVGGLRGQYPNSASSEWFLERPWIRFLPGAYGMAIPAATYAVASINSQFPKWLSVFGGRITSQAGAMHDRRAVHSVRLRQ